MGAVAAVGLLAFAAFLTAAYRMVIKLSGDRLVLIAGLNIVSIALGVLFVPFVPWPTWNIVPYLLASGAAYMTVMYGISRGFTMSDYGVFTPIYNALEVVAVGLLSVLVLREPASILHWVAVLLVVAAIFIKLRPREFRELKHGRTVLWATGVGLAGALQFIVDTGGVRSVDNLATYIVWNLFVGAPIVVFCAVTRRKELRSLFVAQRKPIMVASIMDIVSYALILFVVHGIAVIDVLPILNLQIVFAALLGGLWLKEGQLARRLLASVVLLAAAVLAQFA